MSGIQPASESHALDLNSLQHEQSDQHALLPQAYFEMHQSNDVEAYQ